MHTLKLLLSHPKGINISDVTTEVLCMVRWGEGGGRFDNCQKSVAN